MKKVKFIYNPNSGERRISHELDKIIEIYQQYDYIVVPFRLSKNRPVEDAFLDIDTNYDHILISGGDGTVDLILNAMKATKYRYSHRNFTMLEQQTILQRRLTFHLIQKILLKELLIQNLKKLILEKLMINTL